jgi:hypothetical protein
MGDIALGIEAEQIVAEVGVGEVVDVVDHDIVVADINVLIIYAITARIADGVIAINASVWLQDALIPIDLPATIINNRIIGIIGGLESHATACSKSEINTLDDTTVSSRRQNSIHIVKIHLVPCVRLGA